MSDEQQARCKLCGAETGHVTGCALWYEPAAPASLDLHALARETAEKLLADEGFAYSADVPERFVAIILTALQRVRGHQG